MKFCPHYHHSQFVVLLVILRQVFDMARDGGDDRVEDKFYKGKKIE